MGQNKLESFQYNQSAFPYGKFIAHIPQDFSIDISTTGSIQGVNPGDSKLLAEKLSLVSKNGEGDVTARRIRANQASLVGAGV